MIISVRFRDIDDIHFKIKAVSATSGGHRAIRWPLSSTSNVGFSIGVL